MAKDRETTLSEGISLEEAEQQLAAAKDFELSRTTVIGRSPWEDILAGSLVFLVLDLAFSAYESYPITWDGLVVGPVGILLVVGMLMGIAGVSWLFGGSVLISPQKDLVRHRRREYRLSDLSLPRLLEHEIEMTDRNGQPVHIFGSGMAVSKDMRRDRGEVADKLNEAILIRERYDAIRRRESGPGGPYRSEASAEASTTS